MKHHESVGLHDLIEGFLFSLRAEGKSTGTLEYYSYLLHPLLCYATEQRWPDSAQCLDAYRLREFLTWTSTRTFELKVANNNGKVVKKAKPSTAWPYYRALRRLFNWAVEEGYPRRICRGRAGIPKARQPAIANLNYSNSSG